MDRRRYPIFLLLNVIIIPLLDGMVIMSFIKAFLVTAIFIVLNEILRLIIENRKK